MKKKTDWNDMWTDAVADEARDSDIVARAQAALLSGARRRRERRAARARVLACGGTAAVLALAAMMWPKRERVTRSQVASVAQPVSRQVTENSKPLVPEISQAELAEWFPQTTVALVRRDGRAEVILMPKAR